MYPSQKALVRRGRWDILGWHEDQRKPDEWISNLWSINFLNRIISVQKCFGQYGRSLLARPVAAEALQLGEGNLGRVVRRSDLARIPSKLAV